MLVTPGANRVGAKNAVAAGSADAGVSPDECLAQGASRYDCADPRSESVELAGVEQIAEVHPQGGPRGSKGQVVDVIINHPSRGCDCRPAYRRRTPRIGVRPRLTNLIQPNVRLIGD